MSPNEYQKAALRTAGSALQNNLEGRLTNYALGLTGEAGEFADHVKKFLFHGHDLDTTHLIKELGDQLWYIAMAADALNVTLESVMKVNIDKLKRRFPDGFSSEASINRVENQPDIVQTSTYGQKIVDLSGAPAANPLIDVPMWRQDPIYGMEVINRANKYN